MEEKIVAIIKQNWFNKFPEGIESEGEMTNRGAKKAAKEIVKLFSMHFVRRSFWCKIGLHKLKYTEKYQHTAKVKCTRDNCNAEFIEGEPGRLYRC